MLSEKDRSNIYRVLAVLVLCAMVAALVYLAVVDNVNVEHKHPLPDYLAVPDVSYASIADSSAPVGIRNEYTFTLPENQRDSCLSFYTVHQLAQVYLDGELVYSLSHPETNHFSDTVGSNWNLVPIAMEDAGKEVRVVITPIYKAVKSRQVELLMGSQLAVFQSQLKKDLPQMILSLLAVFVGAVFAIVSLYGTIKSATRISLGGLGIFSMLLGLWRLTDSRFIAFLLPQASVLLFYISTACVMIGAIPMLRWSKSYVPRTIFHIMDVYCNVTLLVALALLVLDFSGNDVRNYLIVNHICMGAGLLLLLGSMTYEYLKNPQKRITNLEPVLFFVCLGCGILDLATYYISGSSATLLFTLLGVLLYTVSVGISTVMYYSRQQLRLAEQERKLAEMDVAIAEQERTLTDERIRMMMSQIRSHFVFNVLATISTYCKIDPKLADRAIVRFSRYLRKNIEIIETNGLISFSEELQQVEDYVLLEQMRFGEMVKFETDVKSASFQIPPLTIQPLVENAIKHGLVSKGKSGTVLLRTRRENGDVVITLTDNGAGFDTTQASKQESVGIRNVRYRLETMVDGTLTIESTPGEGTTVTIRIPKKKEIRQ